MPANQSRITKKNYEDLVKWFEEGNTFDGQNPRTPLRTYVRSDEEVAREKFAKMTPEERKKMRDDRTDALWKKAMPKEKMNKVDDAEFIVAGNVAPERLGEVQKWATSAARESEEGVPAGRFTGVERTADDLRDQGSVRLRRVQPDEQQPSVAEGNDGPLGRHGERRRCLHLPAGRG